MVSGDRIYHTDVLRSTEVPCGRHHQDEIDGLRHRVQELEAMLRRCASVVPPWSDELRKQAIAMLGGK